MSEKRDDYAQLSELVYNDQARNEIESRQYLHQCLSSLNDKCDLLCQGHVEKIVRFRHEDPGRYGPCDLIVIAEIIDATEEKRRRAFVWEVKAPQLPLFEEETKNRVKPSVHLVSAENQLFHYHEDKLGSDAFRDEFGLLSSEDVLLGGILIGRNDNMLKRKNISPEDGERLYRTALRLRRRYIYKKNNMELMTWSNILRRLQPAERGDSILERAGLLDSEMVQMLEEEGVDYVGGNSAKKLTA